MTRMEIGSSLSCCLRPGRISESPAGDSLGVVETWWYTLIELHRVIFANSVLSCLLIPIQAELRNYALLPEVRETTVILNKWSKMSVAEAKRPFLWKTLAEVAAHLYNELGVLQKDHLSKEKNVPLGYMPAVAKHLKELLWRKGPSNADFLVPKISFFEWLANVHEILIPLSWTPVCWLHGTI